MQESRTENKGRKSTGRSPVAAERVLLACGWLDKAEAGDPRLSVEVLTRSHHVVRVIAPDGRTAIIKQPAQEGLQKGRNLARELYVYRLASWIGALANVLPTPFLIDEVRQVLVLESLATGRHWPDDADLLPITSGRTAFCLGAAMSAWHRATKSVSMAPSLAAGILQLPDSLESATKGRPESARALMRRLVSDRELCEALREGETVYQHVCLIHGDIRPDNWLLAKSPGTEKLKVIDWEMSGLGDPAWDVASACAESILQALRAGDGLVRAGEGWPAVTESPLRQLLSGYWCDEGGLDIDSHATWDRLVLFAVARLLHVACEWAEYSVNVDSGLVDQVIGEAKALLRARPQAAASLASWARV